MGEVGEITENTTEDSKVERSHIVLQALFEEGKYDQNQFNQLKGYLDSPQETRQKIAEEIAALAKRSKTPETVQNPRVKKAYETLSKFFSEREDLLKKIKANVIIYDFYAV